MNISRTLRNPTCEGPPCGRPDSSFGSVDVVRSGGREFGDLAWREAGANHLKRRYTE